MRRRGTAFAAAAAALLLCAVHVAAVPSSPLVISPRVLRVSAAPWALAAFDLPAGGDLAVTLRRATGGSVVASGAAAADASGAASVTLALATGAAVPSPGLFTLHAASAAAAWTQDVNVTLVGSAPFVVRALAPCVCAIRAKPRFPHATRRAHCAGACADDCVGQDDVQAGRHGARPRAIADDGPEAFRRRTGACAVGSPEAPFRPWRGRRRACILCARRAARHSAAPA
jgi:hypothetical protein